MRRAARLALYFALAAFFAAGFVTVNLLSIPLAVAGRERVATLVSRGIAMFRRMLRASGLYHDTVPELGALRGHVIAGNHPSLWDAPLVLAANRHTTCFFKSTLRRSMLGLPAARFAGFLPNDSGVEGLILAAARLKAGDNVLVFPEGTRTTRAPVGEFGKSAALLALRANAPVACLAYSYSSPFLAKGPGPLRAPEMPLRVTVRLAGVLNPGDFPDTASLNRAIRELILSALSRSHADTP